MDKLSKQDQEFVKEVVLTGNQTQSVKKAYGIEDDKYASVKGTRLIAKDSITTAIEEVKRTLAERIPDDLLERVHKEGLEASDKLIRDGEIIAERPDYAVRHKYLDTAYKLKGSYAPDKSININLNVKSIDPTDPEIIESLRTIQEKLENE